MQSTVNTHLSLSRQMYISHLNDLEETNLASIHFLAVLSNFILKVFVGLASHPTFRSLKSDTFAAAAAHGRALTGPGYSA